MTRALFHFALSLGLFLTVNAIGRRLYSRGYIHLSVLPKHDQAPAVNTGLRLVTPLVYLVLASAALYRLGWDDIVVGIWAVSVYYVLFRWFFNLALGRGALLNWPRELAIAAGIVGCSFWLSENVIRHRVNILPEPQGLATEVWVLVVAFLFYMVNELGGGDTGSERRKKRYVLRRAETLKRRYAGELLAGIPGKNDKLEALILGIMVYESFNRPFLARLVEYGAFLFGRAKTLGIMQVTTDRWIGDRESVRRGIETVVASWELHREDSVPRLVAWNVARDYNPDDAYAKEIVTLGETIANGLFAGSQDRLGKYEVFLGQPPNEWDPRC